MVTGGWAICQRDHVLVIETDLGLDGFSGKGRPGEIQSAERTRSVFRTLLEKNIFVRSRGEEDPPIPTPFEGSYVVLYTRDTINVDILLSICTGVVTTLPKHFQNYG